MKNKRVILLLGLIVILSGWWITRSDSPAPPQEGVLDVWATWGENPDHLQTFLDHYSQLSGILVRVTTQVRSDDLEEALSGKEQPDLVILSNGDLVETYYQEGFVESLDSWIDKTDIEIAEIFPALLERCKSPDARYVCLPWGGDVDVLYWNKELFAAAGLDPEQPPQTMEELVEYAEKLTLRNEDGELRQVGFIPDFPRPHTDLYVQMFGGGIDELQDADLLANSQSVVEALDWQQQFNNIYTLNERTDFIASFTPYMNSSHPIYAESRLSCQQCHRSSKIRNKKTPDAGFFEGRIAMMIDGEWQVSSDEFSEEQFLLNYGVAPFPPSMEHPESAKTTVVQGPVVIIPKGTIDKAAAVRLLAWMISPENLAEAADVHFMLPVTRMATQDARFQKNPAFKLFIELMDSTNTRIIITSR